MTEISTERLILRQWRPTDLEPFAELNAHPEVPAVEVGWRLAQPAWGHGYATEAARAATSFGFGELDLAEIVSFTTAANRRSRRVMERLGMTHDQADDFEHPQILGTPLAPHVLYRLRRAP
jgi:RimJ/RimL family protein N-acetyltransferase